jgi:hypothetical protein
MKHIKHGGCQCGRIRYTAELEHFNAYLCHCRMCQRATGGVSIAFITLHQSNRHWSQTPEYFASSSFARRPFCKECGTPLGFEYVDSDKCDLTIGSFDEPYDFVPTAHFAAESIHEAWVDTRALKRDRSDDYAPLVKRWEDAGKQS